MKKRLYFIPVLLILLAAMALYFQNSPLRIPAGTRDSVVREFVQGLGDGFSRLFRTGRRTKRVEYPEIERINNEWKILGTLLY